jgi:hypothetical protein
MLKAQRQPIEVYAKAPGKIYKHTPLAFRRGFKGKVLFIPRRLFTGALLHIEMRGIDDAIDRCP